MAVIKCKMCGGDLILTQGSYVAECEYCGSRQTVPSADNEKKLNLFARANRLRANNEFDKAAGVYETIVADFPEEAEAWWGLILCKYGIEYVDDPATGKKIPTCHRSSFNCLMDDHSFEMVMENADPVARRVYREEAKQIEELRKGIIEVSSKEEPYDIFICYKETAEDGQRTLDSVLAQDIYDMLTENGYRVFFSRVSLEDKLGVEYEPYIFAALNSAKIMLAIGTDYDYYNAVWVKNEWSRFLQLIANGEKKTLIPCYKGIDAYDMPKEFVRLQAQDLGKVGAMQDLLRGIKKILPKAAPSQPVVQQVIQSGGPNLTSLLKRGEMAMEDRQWETAANCFEEALRMDAESHDAYLGLAMAHAEVKDRDEFAAAYIDRRIKDTTELKRARSFADAEQSAWWTRLDAQRKTSDERKAAEEEQIRQETERKKKEEAYQQAAALLSEPDRGLPSEKRYRALQLLEQAGDYQDSAERAETCRRSYLQELSAAAGEADAKRKRAGSEAEAARARRNQLDQEYAGIRKGSEMPDPRKKMLLAIIGAIVGAIGMGILQTVYDINHNGQAVVENTVVAAILVGIACGALAFVIGLILTAVQTAKATAEQKAAQKQIEAIQSERMQMQRTEEQSAQEHAEANARYEQLSTEIGRVNSL